MHRKLWSQLTYANVISTLCLFLLVSGGAAYAASLGKNTVGPKQLKKNAVTAAKIKNGVVTAAKIKPGTLTGAQIDTAKLGTVPAATTAATATTATTATTALNATSLDGNLASGKTLRGNFAVAGTNDPSGFVDENAISFAIPLAKAPEFHSLTPGAPPTAECPGSAANPTAAPGHACFYETVVVNTTGNLEFRNPGRFGTSYFTPATAVGSYNARGLWAVTAP